MSSPTRTCAGCGRKAPKAKLWRYVARNGTLSADPAGTAAGRGAYTCPERPCVERAAARGGFSHVLRRSVSIPSSLQGLLRED
jgi:uncharacterized protein